MEVIDYIVKEGLILIPFLNILGMLFKGTEKIPDKYIPLILLAFGVAFSIALLGFNVTSIIQGVLITGVAVYGNQLVKQFKKDKE